MELPNCETSDSQFNMYPPFFFFWSWTEEFSGKQKLKKPGTNWDGFLAKEHTYALKASDIRISIV